jgi:hypothetical protein
VGGKRSAMVHYIEHLVLILIVFLGLVHTGSLVTTALAEFLELVRKVVEIIRKIWEELTKF